MSYQQRMHWSNPRWSCHTSSRGIMRPLSSPTQMVICMTTHKSCYTGWCEWCYPVVFSAVSNVRWFAGSISPSLRAVGRQLRDTTLFPTCPLYLQKELVSIATCSPSTPTPIHYPRTLPMWVWPCKAGYSSVCSPVLDFCRLTMWSHGPSVISRASGTVLCSTRTNMSWVSGWYKLTMENYWVAFWTLCMQSILSQCMVQREYWVLASREKN